MLCELTGRKDEGAWTNASNSSKWLTNRPGHHLRKQRVREYISSRSSDDEICSTDAKNNGVAISLDRQTTYAMTSAESCDEFRSMTAMSLLGEDDIGGVGSVEEGVDSSLLTGSPSSTPSGCGSCVMSRSFFGRLARACSTKRLKSSL